MVSTMFSGKKDLRQLVVEAARSQIGEQDPDQYWAVVQPQLMGNPKGISWCGGFALWALKQAGLAADLVWHIGRGFAEVYRLPKVKVPEPGDIAYYDQPFQHHAVVDRVEGDTVFTIDGNQSPGESVLPRERNLKAATAYYSIQPLLDKVEV